MRLAGGVISQETTQTGSVRSQIQILGRWCLIHFLTDLVGSVVAGSIGERTRLLIRSSRFNSEEIVDTGAGAKC